MLIVRRYVTADEMYHFLRDLYRCVGVIEMTWFNQIAENCTSSELDSLEQYRMVLESDDPAFVKKFVYKMEQTSPKEKTKFYIGDGAISWHTKSPRKIYTVFNEWFRKGMWKPQNAHCKKFSVDVPFENEKEFIEICENLGIRIHE